MWPRSVVPPELCNTAVLPTPTYLQRRLEPAKHKKHRFFFKKGLLIKGLENKSYVNEKSLIVMIENLSHMKKRNVDLSFLAAMWKRKRQRIK